MGLKFDAHQVFTLIVAHPDVKETLSELLQSWGFSDTSSSQNLSLCLRCLVRSPAVMKTGFLLGPVRGSCLSYHHKETILFTIDPHSGNLNIKSANRNPEEASMIRTLPYTVPKTSELLFRDFCPLTPGGPQSFKALQPCIASLQKIRSHPQPQNAPKPVKKNVNLPHNVLIKPPFGEGFKLEAPTS